MKKERRKKMKKTTLPLIPLLFQTYGVQ